MLKCASKFGVTGRPLAIATAVVAGIIGGEFGRPSAANAALVLTLSEPGFFSQTYNDNATPGEVTFIGAYGNFSTDIVIGFTNLASPSPNIAQLQLQSLQVTNTGTGGPPDTLTITLQETSPYTFPGTATSVDTLTSALGGTLAPSRVGDSVTFQSYAYPSVGPSVTSGLQTYASTVATAGTAGFQVPNASASFVQTPSYTLESITNLSIAPGESSNISATTTVLTTVPEPASIGIVGGLGMLLLGRRRRV